MRIRSGLIPLTSLFIIASAAMARDIKPLVVDADNTGRNQIHDGSRAPTAEQQGKSKADIDLTRKIRRAITDEKALSTNARNVKIISNQGHVLLKGPVESSAEKSIIEGKAVTVAGRDNVHSEIEITGN